MRHVNRIILHTQELKGWNTKGITCTLYDFCPQGTVLHIQHLPISSCYLYATQALRDYPVKVNELHYASRLLPSFNTAALAWGREFRNLLHPFSVAFKKSCYYKSFQKAANCSQFKMMLLLTFQFNCQSKFMKWRQTWETYVLKCTQLLNSLFISPKTKNIHLCPITQLVKTGHCKYSETRHRLLQCC